MTSIFSKLYNQKSKNTQKAIRKYKNYGELNN